MKDAWTRFGDRLRRFLGKRGYVLSHFEAGVPERLESYLGGLGARGPDFEQIRVFDGDPETLNVFLAVFAARRVRFHSEPKLEIPSARIKQGERILLAADLEAMRFEPDSPLLFWLVAAPVVVVRSKLGHFRTGKADLGSLAALMEKLGFHLHDVLHQPSGPVMGAAGGNVFLAFERGEGLPGAGGKGRAFRVSEALTILSAPIVPESALKRLTGRGSCGFSAGVFNPGAFHDGRRLHLLARGERDPWPVQRLSRASYLSSCQPLLLTLRDDFQIQAATEVRSSSPPASAGIRHEDFRLFTHQGVVYSNHCCIRCGDDLSEGMRLRPERLATSVEISRFDVDGALLTHLGPLALERPVARMEKNWAMFSAGDRVQLIYSFNPYRLFSASAFPDLRFVLAAEHSLKLSLAEDGLSFRNSINPVPWDADHFLHIVHKVYPEKRYVFWAVLLDRRTHLPVKITRRPLITDRSSAASITYVSSALCREDDLLLFGGLDDCSLGAWRIWRDELNSQWAPVG